MGRYLSSLAKRGIVARIVGEKVRFTPEPPPALKAQIEASMPAIIAELRNGVEFAELSQSTPNTASRVYSQPGHDLDAAEESYRAMFATAADEGVNWWNWEGDEPRPPMPYCYLKCEPLNAGYIYLPMIVEATGESVWAV